MEIWDAYNSDFENYGQRGDEMTRVYFVRHAQPDHGDPDDRNRPLTEEGKKDSELVLKVLADERIDCFYCSPYKRSIDTIKETADYFHKDIITDDRLREREAGMNGNGSAMFRKRWGNHDYHEEGGESISMVQKRNIEALMDILEENRDRTIVIGTHGTALSTIFNYFNPSFGCEDFLRIIDWMPYIVRMDFDGKQMVGVSEIAHIEKEFKG